MATTATDRHRYRRRSLGVAEVLVGALGFGLWLLWPRADRVAAHARPRRATAAVAYGRVRDQVYMSPTLFAHPSGSAFKPAEEPVAGMEALPRPRRIRAAEPAEAARAAPPNPARPLEAYAAAELPDYRATWQDTPLFDRPLPAAPQLVVRAAPALAARGFAADGFAAAIAAGGAAAWQVEAAVDMAADGVAEHVLLVRPGEDAAVNAAVVRELQRSRLAGPGPRCAGHVTVSYSGGRASGAASGAGGGGQP